jgi:diacylglycerol kinase (ATP)
VNARPRALVVLNPQAHGGAGIRRFEAVRAEIESRLDAQIVLTETGSAWDANVHAALEEGTRVFVAAGGDGTAHSLVDVLIAASRRPPLAELTLGAVGLGSSNDFHKPVKHRIGGVPIRLDVAHAVPRDVVQCRYRDGTSFRITHVLVSASIGCIAHANERFARGTGVTRALRRLSTAAAITWASLCTIATWQDLPARLQVNGGAIERARLTSLSVLKTEWLSGRLRFGHPIAPASGDFDVALAEAGGRLRLGADVVALMFGHFDGRAGHRRFRAQSLDVFLDRESWLELDGEIARAREVHFSILPERIRLCA